MAISLDVSNTKALDAEVRKNDVVVSLIPYTFHADVIKSAIREKKHVVTTSYVSPAMMELDEAAKEAGITVMNEIGLDPGLDHLYAVKMIDDVHSQGGKIRSFYSYCGGLPAPEASDNPLGYKFSWSPRGVLLAARNDAKFYKNGKIIEIPGQELMKNATPWFIYPGFAFLGYPNRDSTPFRESYNIPEAQNLLRGSLRYQGNPAFVQVLNDMGFFSDDKVEELTKPITWAEATRHVLGASTASSSDLASAVSSCTSFADETEKTRILGGLRWIGMFSSEKITPAGTPLDVLCAELEKKMQYGPGERDMVMLQHKFEVEKADGSIEWRTSTLCDYGDPNGYSAMARLVGVPAGVAILQVLDGTIADGGILAPLNKKLCDPLMRVLKEKYGIALEEKIVES